MKPDFLGPLIIVSIAAVGGASAMRTSWGDALADGFVDGGTQSRLEEALDDKLVIRDGAIKAWNALRYAVFNEGVSGVVPGTDGWLYTDEEYQVPTDYDVRLADSIQTIVDATVALEGMGSHVIVALLPDKARIVDEYIARERAPVLLDRYDTTIRELRLAGIDVVDARAALRENSKDGTLFLARDTHWTPTGAKVVAAAIAPRIKELVAERTQFQTSVSEQILHEGDLVKFVDAGILNDALGLIAEPVEISVTSQLESADLVSGLFGSSSVPVTLVGTSYSAISKWNFVGFLMQESETDIANKALKGQGPFEPMARYLDEIEGGAEPSEVVVWEIPERYLTVGVEK